MSGDLIGQIEEFLADDIPALVDAIVDAAEIAERRGYRGDRFGLGFPDPARVWSALDEREHVPEQPIGSITADDLVLVAQRHERMATELREDAEWLREIASEMHNGTGRGASLVQHLTAMREEADFKREEWERSWAVARGEGGVCKWSAIPGAAQDALQMAGLLTVDDVAAAASDGRLWDVPGIGPGRLHKILQALKEGA